QPQSAPIRKSRWADPKDASTHLYPSSVRWISLKSRRRVSLRPNPRQADVSEIDERQKLGLWIAMGKRHQQQYPLARPPDALAHQSPLLFAPAQAAFLPSGCAAYLQET